MAKKRGAKAGIEGGRELADKFQKIGRDIENEIEQALLIGALRVERDAKINAPVDTGRLRNSVSSRLIDTDTGPVAEVGTNVTYAAAVEYGTSKAVAKPFLFPAYNNNKSKILKELAKAFRRGVGL